MRKHVFCLWLCVIVALVSSHPTSQRGPQQHFRNPAQFPPNQPQRNNQNVKVPNQTPNPANFDGALLNDLLMNKILGNPSLQKILDPNTKLYKQNGQEILRQPNHGVTPSIVNNYFIVPPEFFTIKGNKTVTKAKNKNKTTKNGLEKTKPKSKKSQLKEQANIGNEVELIEEKENNKSNMKKTKKKKKQTRSEKLIEEPKSTIKTDREESMPEENNVKKKRRKNRSRHNNKSSTVASPSKQTIIDKSANNITEFNSSKKQRKVKTIPAVDINRDSDTKRQPTKSVRDDFLAQSVELHSSVSDFAVPKEILPAPGMQPENSKLTMGLDKKLVELPSKNRYAQENIRPAKRTQEVQSTITSKMKSKTEPKQTNSPATDDFLRNFLPYMYLDNNFYTNNNYPFNFEQFYQPYLSTNTLNSSISKKPKNKQPKTEPLPNTVEVKLKPKKQKVITTTTTTTTAKPEFIENTGNDPSESVNVNRSVESIEVMLDDSENKVNDKSQPQNKTDKDITLQTSAPKQESVKLKVNLEMPPTVIEDLHPFITTELGREDAIPMAHTNVIINDYYPIFHDESYYKNARKHIGENLEDDRYFYTTDRGFDENFTNGNRNLDSREEFINSNANFEQRVNIRRPYSRERVPSINKEFDSIKMYDLKPEHENEIHKIEDISEEISENEDTKQENTIEDFRTPPLLENPDFRTRKIERLYPVYDPTKRYESLESSSEVEVFSDVNPIQYNRLALGSELNKDEASESIRPANDKIETVFAKTRVVRYGAARGDDYEEIASTPVDNRHKTFFDDGHTTYVMAKSLGKPEDYFW